MFRVNLSDSFSEDSDVFSVKQSSGEHSLTKNNTTELLNSSQLSEAMAPEVIVISSVASLKLEIVTIESDSNIVTIPYDFGRQQPVTLFNLIDLNRPMGSFNMMIPLSSAPVTEPTIHPPTIDDIPIQEELFDVPKTSTQSLMVSSVKVWETSSDVETFFD